MTVDIKVEGDELAADLMLTSGGRENVGAQYALPNSLGFGVPEALWVLAHQLRMMCDNQNLIYGTPHVCNSV